MKKILFLLVILSVFIVSCSGGESEDLSGKLNQECKADGTCDSGLACKANKCISEVDACKNITCLNHGTCIIEASKAVCNCESGYVRKDDTKCIASNVCNDITCSDHGTCEEFNGSPRCNCNAGYSTDGTGERCLKNLDPCANISCGGSDRGTCVVNDNVVSCDCKPNYHVQDTTCVSDSNACDGIDCGGSNKGTCELNGTSAFCNCKTGYIPSGLLCIDENNNPCEGQSCSGHGSCEIHNDVAICICSEGYTPSANLTCLGEGNGAPECEGILCEDSNNVSRGDCRVDGDGNPTCLCDNGYFKANLMCLIKNDNPCNVANVCSDKGICRVDDYDEGYCDCEDGYFPTINMECVDKNSICTPSITCSNHGVCDVNSDGTATCDCQEGFVAIGTDCVSNPCEPNPCLNIENGDSGRLCTAISGNSYACACAIGFSWNSAISECEANSCGDNMHLNNGNCVCDNGYELDDGDYCVLIGGACDSNPCAGTLNTKCEINDGVEDGYVCVCKDGYTEDQFGNCVVEACSDSPCLTNNEDNRNTCVADGNTYKCECDDGFTENSGVCEPEQGAACNSNPCNSVANSTGECVANEFNNTDYYCVCDSGYTWNGVDACISCDICTMANATGNCEMGWDSLICECTGDLEFVLDENGVGTCE